VGDDVEEDGNGWEVLSNISSDAWSVVGECV
jgi:hypothetical protein